MKTSEKEKNKDRFTYTDEEYSKLSHREREIEKGILFGVAKREALKLLNTEEDGKSQCKTFLRLLILDVR